MADPRTVLKVRAREGSDYRISAKFVDTAGAIIPGENLTELSLTLYVENTGQILNLADGVNILNNGRGSVDSSGNLIISLLPADNPIMDDSLLEEVHVALVEWTYNAGLSKGKQEFEYRVRNLAFVP